MNIDQIGVRLTSYRKNMNMTIKEFSNLSGVSTALLSQLERGIGNPSLSVLDSIAKTMNISISSLFEETVNLEKLVKRVQDQSVITDSEMDGIQFQLLTKKSANLSADLYKITFSPHSETKLLPFGVNEVEELILVEKGPLVMCDENGNSITLKKGDTMRLIPNFRYKLVNTTSHDVIFLYVTSNSREVL